MKKFALLAALSLVGTAFAADPVSAPVQVTIGEYVSMTLGTPENPGFNIDLTGGKTSGDDSNDLYVVSNFDFVLTLSYIRDTLPSHWILGGGFFDWNGLGPLGSPTAPQTKTTGRMYAVSCELSGVKLSDGTGTRTATLVVTLTPAS